MNAFIWLQVYCQGSQAHPCLVDSVFVESDQTVDGVFPDFEAGQMRQEIVSDEEAHEDPVVDGALEVVREGQVLCGEIKQRK